MRDFDVTSTSGRLIRPGGFAGRGARLLLGAAAVALSMTAAVTADVPTDGTRWEWLDIGGGGWQVSVDFHPAEKDLIYARSDVAGAHRWDPKTNQWADIYFNIPPKMREKGLPTGIALALDPSDSDVLYLALQAMATYPGAPSGVGPVETLPGALLRSTKRGEPGSWSLLLDKQVSYPHKFANSLAVDPDDRTVLYVGLADGLHVSRNATAGQGAVTFSKVDGGPSERISHIVVTRANAKGGKAVYVATMGQGVHRSTDGGKTFSSLPDSPPQTLQLALGKDGVVYAASSRGLKRFDGNAWSDASPPGLAEKEIRSVAVDPHEPSRVVTVAAGTKDVWAGRESNGELTWTKHVGDAKQGATVTADPKWNHSIEWSGIDGLSFDPARPGHLWWPSTYGVFQTDNVYADKIAWQTRIRGQETTMLMMLAAPPEGDTLLYAGLHDVVGFRWEDFSDPIKLQGLVDSPSDRWAANIPGIAYQWDDGRNAALLKTNIIWDWSASVGGPPAAKHPDPSEGASAANDVAVTRDGGKTWTRTTPPYPGPDGRSVFSGPAKIALAKNDPDNMVIIGYGQPPVYTKDGGRAWAKGDLPNTKALASPKLYSWAQPLTPSLVEDNTFYCYVPDKSWNDSTRGWVYKSTDGGATWRVPENQTTLPAFRLWNAGQLEHYVLKAPPVKGEVWFSSGRLGLWRSSDDAVTFTRVPTVEYATNFCFGAPAPGSTTPALYIHGKLSTGQIGVFRSTDFGKSWTCINDNVAAHEQATVMEGDGRTFGRVYLNGIAGVRYSTAPRSQ